MCRIFAKEIEGFRCLSFELVNKKAPSVARLFWFSRVVAELIG